MRNEMSNTSIDFALKTDHRGPYIFPCTHEVMEAVLRNTVFEKDLRFLHERTKPEHRTWRFKMFTHHKTLFSLMAVLLLSIAAAKSSPAPTDYNRSDTEDIETKEQRSGEETDESTELFDDKQLGSMGTQESYDPISGSHGFSGFVKRETNTNGSKNSESF
uniref:Uncharacterized protein n=1 Tax=Magallana gigas TaxID=29159 RepID=K1PT94_MAGGI